MSKLIRIEGRGGSKIYSGKHWEADRAKEDYLELTGYEPEKADVLDFDCIDWSELQAFARRGNE